MTGRDTVEFSMNRLLFTSNLDRTSGNEIQYAKGDLSQWANQEDCKIFVVSKNWVNKLPPIMAQFENGGQTLHILSWLVSTGLFTPELITSCRFRLMPKKPVKPTEILIRNKFFFKKRKLNNIDLQCSLINVYFKILFHISSPEQKCPAPYP